MKLSHFNLFYFGLLASFLMLWNPIRELAYGAPYLFLLVALLFHRTHIVARLFFLATLLSIHILFAAQAGSLAWINVSFAVITYGSIVFALAVPNRAFQSQRLRYKSVRLAYIVLIAEAAVGLVQAAIVILRTGTIDGGSGDFVFGTLALSAEQRGAANPLYAVSLAILFIIVAYSTEFSKRQKMLAASISIPALLSTGVMHVIVAFVFYQLFVLIRGTRALQMFIGLFVLIIISFFAQWLNLNALNWILSSLKTVWVIAFVILFQPELRKALTMLGQNRMIGLFIKVEESSTVSEITKACKQLFRRGSARS